MTRYIRLDLHTLLYSPFIFSDLPYHRRPLLFFKFMDDKVLLQDDSEYFLNQELLTNPVQHMSSGFLSSSLDIHKPVYTIKRKAPPNFSTYGIKRTADDNYIMNRIDHFISQDEPPAPGAIPGAASLPSEEYLQEGVVPTSLGILLNCPGTEINVDKLEEILFSNVNYAGAAVSNLTGQEVISAPVHAVAASQPLGDSQSVLTEESPADPTLTLHLPPDLSLGDNLSPKKLMITETYSSAAYNEETPKSPVTNQLSDVDDTKDDIKRKTASPAVGGPPSKKEKINTPFSFIGLSQQMLFADDDYDYDASLPRNINRSVRNLGSKASTVKSSTLMANYIDPAIEVVSLPDPMEDKIADALYLCNVLTSQHLARLDNDNANLRATNKLLLQEKTAIEDKATVNLHNHSVEGRNVKDYERIRRQLSEEREAHLCEIQADRKSSKAKLDDLICQEKNLREFISTSMKANFDLKISMMETNHTSMMNYLQSQVQELQQKLSLKKDDGGDQLSTALEQAKQQLLEKQAIVDSSEAEIADLTATNKILTQELDSAKSLLSEEKDVSLNLQQKLNNKTATTASLRTTLKDADGVSTSLRALMEEMKKENLSLINSSAEGQKAIAELSKMNDEVERLVKVETEYKNLQATLPHSVPVYEEKIAQLTKKYNDSEADLKAKMKTLAKEQEEVIRLHGVNSHLQQDNVEQQRINSSLSDDLSDLLQEVDIVKKELQQTMADKLNLLEKHREEKKSLRRGRSDCEPSSDSVSFQRRPLSEQDPPAETGSPSKPDSVLLPESLLPPGAFPQHSEEDQVDKEKEKNEARMDEDDPKKHLFPPYDKKDGFKKTAADKKTDAEEQQEQDLQLTATEDDVKFDDETSDENYADKAKGGRKGIKRSEDGRDFKSPSPRNDPEKEKRRNKNSRDNSRSSERSADRSSGRSRGNSLSGEKNFMTVEEAATHVSEIKQKVQTYVTHLDGNRRFKETMRSNEDEEVKFKKMEKCLSGLLRSDNFHEFKEFIRGNEIPKKPSRIAKGALPNMREGSKEWQFMQEFPDSSRKPENALIHFNNGIVAFRPYCEPLYEALTVLIAAGGDHKDATQLLFTRPFEKNLLKDDDAKVKRSKEERKFELLCVVAIAKTYFSLKLGKDVKANRSEKILCESDPYTRAWANELTSMIDNDANHAKYRTLMPLYVETSNCAAAVRVFYNDLSALKNKKESDDNKFQW